MLRRRSKQPKIERHETPGPQAKGRRRGRADVPVPERLRVKATPAPREERPPREQRPVREEKPVYVSGVVLVTGFEPFGGERTNPSWDVCARLPKEIGGLRVETVRVPCEFRRSIEVLAEAIERH